MTGSAAAPRQVRARYRHDLRTLTYITLDEGNGGIVRNLSDRGVGVQAVAALRPRQTVRLRFEPTRSKVRVDVHGEVSWANSSGQCGIRFLDLSPHTKRQLNQWIFESLLEFFPRDAVATSSIFGNPGLGSNDFQGCDGLIISSASPRPAIRLEAEPEAISNHELEYPTSPRVRMKPPTGNDFTRNPNFDEDEGIRPDWLFATMSSRNIALLVDALVVTAGLLLFSLVFVATTHELPRWPVAARCLGAGGLFVVSAYWALLREFGGSSLGRQVAHLTSRNCDEKVEKEINRFR